MNVADLVAAMESIAPLELAETWDNVGLLVGDASRPLAGPVLLTIDLSDAVLDEAIAMKAGAIVAYHPPIFSPLKRLTAASAGGARLLRLAEHGIAVYSPHTALDAAPGGVTDWLIARACSTEPDAPARDSRTRACESLAGASGSEVKECSALAAARLVDPNQTHKIVVFVPREAAERVRDAMSSTGAGVVGAYERCSFMLEGVGTFLGGEGTNPAVGQRGKLESVNEVRLEMVCGEGSLPAVVAALRGAHPYEEPAFDVYALAPKPRAGTGPGRIATLTTPTAVEEIARRLKAGLPSQFVSLAVPERRAPQSTQGARREVKDQRSSIPDPSLPTVSSVCSVVHRIAAVPGSGGALLDAAIEAGADCFLTGEMKHHEVLSALERGCAIILAGHTESERGYLPRLADRLKPFRAHVSRADRPPLISG